MPMDGVSSPPSEAMSTEKEVDEIIMQADDAIRNITPRAFIRNDDAIQNITPPDFIRTVQPITNDKAVREIICKHSAMQDLLAALSKVLTRTADSAQCLIHILPWVLLSSGTCL